MRFALLCRAGLFALLWLLAAAPLAGAGVAESFAVARRTDAALSYVSLERAMAEQTIPAAQRDQLNRRFDYLARQMFRRNWERAVRDLDAATDAILPAAERAPSQRAARATQARVEPEIAVAGEVETVAFHLAPLYQVERRPDRLRVRVAKEAGDVVFRERFRTAGDRVVWRPDADLPAGRYEVQIGGHGDGSYWRRGYVTILPQSPAALRTSLEQRLEAAVATMPPDREDLRRSALALSSRLGLLDGTSPAVSMTSTLTNLAALSEELPQSVAALEHGDDPYANRPGDYWRTIDLGPPLPLTIPSRIYAPADALAMAARDGVRLPLVIALHGAGGDENLFMEGYGVGLVKRLADEHGFIVLSPQTYPVLADARSLGLLVDTMADLYPIDLDRVYAVGHSLGAITAAGWTAHGGDYLAAVGLLAGGGESVGNPNRVATFVAAAEYDRIFREARLRGLAESAARSGAKSVFRVYEDQSHASMVPAALPDAIAWMLEQRRSGDAADAE